MIHRAAVSVFYPRDHMGGWSWVGMGLVALIFVAVAVWVMWVVVRPRSTGQHPTALEIVEQRYARGEIDEEELRRRRETLQGGGGSKG